MKPLSLFAILSLTLFAYGQNIYDLEFNVGNYQSQTLNYQGKSFTVRAYENIVYVANPIDTAHQKMNVYIPDEYFNDKTVNGYSAKTAPIFFPNKIGGYMPAQPASLKDNPMGIRPPINGERLPLRDPNQQPLPPIGNIAPKPLTIIVALSRGYVVASAGARGRTTKDNISNYTGKAPAGIVDLKAAVRYLKFNDKTMPGNANKIISNGTSAGGAMSTLLGATGNNPDYVLYLKQLGAANAADNIFAVSAYCPITNLDNADLAYEWQFNGINSYKAGGPMAGNNTKVSMLNDEQISVSKQLADLFPAYINDLGLKDKVGSPLKLDKNGNGNFKELVVSYVIASAQKAIEGGIDLSSFIFLTIENGKVTQLDFSSYVKYMERQKMPPAFDAFDISSPENMLFGTASVDKQHFTDFSTTQTTVNIQRADLKIVKMMNPMYYIGQPNTTTSKFWRIRHGAKDKDTGLAIPIILATYLQNKGYNVNLELPWEKTHSGDYDLEELFTWIDCICR